MLITLSCKDTEIAVDSFGAELHSIKVGGCEYLWQCGDPWKRYAPILFPFICSPEGRKYRAGGREYTMPANHGFARDRRFYPESVNETSVVFALDSDDESKRVYPYDFHFTAGYEVADGRVKVSHKVKNMGTEPMYFYLGGHPAFNCPLESGLAFDDYYVEYSREETIVQPIPGGERTLVEGGRRLDLSRELFDHDVIMKDAPKSDSVTLRSDKGTRFVTVEFPESRCIAVWSPGKDNNAAFVCLEPWTSVPVYADDEFADIESKPHAIRLEAGAEYEYSYSIIAGR